MAILEEKHSKWESYVSDRVPMEFSVRRKLSNLAPKYSVVVCMELEIMNKVDDLDFMRHLWDDLQTKVIPRYKDRG